jgi:ferredoxin
MTVLEGAENLAPPTARETATLARNDADPDQRLACQCRMPASPATLLFTMGYW